MTQPRQVTNREYLEQIRNIQATNRENSGNKQGIGAQDHIAIGHTPALPLVQTIFPSCCGTCLVYCAGNRTGFIHKATEIYGEVAAFSAVGGSCS